MWSKVLLFQISLCPQTKPTHSSHHRDQSEEMASTITASWGKRHNRAAEEETDYTDTQSVLWEEIDWKDEIMFGCDSSPSLCPGQSSLLQRGVQRPARTTLPAASMPIVMGFSRLIRNTLAPEISMRELQDLADTKLKVCPTQRVLSFSLAWWRMSMTAFFLHITTFVPFMEWFLWPVLDVKEESRGKHIFVDRGRSRWHRSQSLCTCKTSRPSLV